MADSPEASTLAEGGAEEPIEALDARIGEAAVRLKMLSTEQVERTLASHPVGAGGRAPGQVFVDAGLLSAAQLDYLQTVRRFKAQRAADKRFGDRVVDHGWASREAVHGVLETQKRAFLKERREVPVGDLMVEEELITEVQRDQVLEEQRQDRVEAEEARAATPPEPEAPEPEASESGASESEAPEPGASESGASEPEASESEASEPEASEPEASESEASESEALEPLRLDIADDHLSAYLTLEPGAAPPPLDEVEALLQQNGVVHGRDEAAIARLGAGEVEAGTPVAVARAEPPQPGRDGAIEFYFETEPLKAGTETEDGRIDYKDRGEIPQVEEGMVLARKELPSEGQAGTDIFGRAVPPPPPRDPPLAAGKGVELAADGLTATAAVGGHPRVSATGVVSVFPEYTIDEDVAYNTGHVDFDGRVVVMGSIRKGFRVRCGELVAQEAEEAEIEAEGDVQITGGVLGARITAGGTVRAHYLHDARLAAMGDVLVDKEVIDSSIETSGAFRGERCTVMSSTIAAKQGVFAKEIGSETSRPCRLVAGVDERLDRELAELEAEVAAKEKELAANAARLEQLTTRRQELDVELAELAQVQDRGQVREREIRSGLEAGELERDRVEAELRKLEREVKEAEERVTAGFDEQDRVMDEMDGLREQEPAVREALEEAQGRLDNLKAWAEQNPGLARIQAGGTLRQGTRIKTPRHEVKLTRDYSRVTLEEQARTNERGQKVWRLGRVR